jgi:beta-glucosidase
VLPLPSSGLKRVAVIGPNAAHARVQGGGSARVAPPYTVSPLEGLIEALGPEVEVVHTAGAHTTTGLRPFDRTQVSFDGRPGLRVRLRDESGQVWRDEHRAGGWLLWMGVPEVGRIAEIEASCVFRAPIEGTYRLGFGGVGDVVMTVDGRTAFEGTVDPSLKNHFAALLAPIDTTYELPLAAGREVAIEVRLRPDRRSLDVALLMVGVEPPRRTEEDELAHAARLAADSDVAVVVVGTTEQIESEGFDRTSIALPGRQDDLVGAVTAANPDTVVVVNAGGPVAMPWLDEVAATLLTWFPGQEGGHALADVLTGAAEPGGRMPTTWTAREPEETDPSPIPEDGRLVYREGLRIGYRAWHGDRTPALPFGSGLGYTTWRYDALDLLPGAEGTVARVTLSNLGSRAGTEVVQVYLARPDSAVERPARWLAGFAKVRADGGRTVTVDVPLPSRVRAHWSAEEQRWAEEPGAFEVHVGGDVVRTPLRALWAA